MRIFIPLIVLFVSLLPSLAIAHQCKLEGSSAEAILVYNSCKADLAAGISQHQSDATKPRNERELALEDENARLKQKLGDVRNTLLDILKNLPN
ncbi:hypothetical protein N9X12_02265 [Alphaproteobacteria bacterium]|nr:hypothetical protein [Alphaproteobacteria bacterium]